MEHFLTPRSSSSPLLLSSFIHGGTSLNGALITDHRCSAAIKINQNNVEAYFIRGTVSIILGDIKSARSFLKQGLKFDPENRSLKEELKVPFLLFLLSFFLSFQSEIGSVDQKVAQFERNLIDRPTD